MKYKIVEKLNDEITRGLTRESQVVYLLTGLRKIIEQENIPRSKYFYLRFHCDWVLHAKLDRNPAQQILNHFNSAYLNLRDGKHTWEGEFDSISKMNCFQKELSEFLQIHKIQDFSQSPVMWPQFLYLYSRVIEDIPLIISDEQSAHIREVVVSVKSAKEMIDNHQPFKISWLVKDKNNELAEFYVINSYEVPQKKSLFKASEKRRKHRKRK